MSDSEAPYDNVYKLYCDLCKKAVRIKNPKTLHRPDCPSCSATKCRLPSDRIEEVNYRYVSR